MVYQYCWRGRYPVGRRCACRGHTVETEEAGWLRHLLPLPHEIAIHAKQIVRPDQIGITLRNGPGMWKSRLALISWRCLPIKPAKRRPARPIKSGLARWIREHESDSGRRPSAPARSAPCRQAYTIQNAGANRLVVAALNERGCIMGLHLEPAAGTGVIVQCGGLAFFAHTRWPDMDERGMWNGTCELAWLAGLKLNYYRTMGHYATPVQRDQKPTFVFEQINTRRVRAFNPVVSFPHLNFLNEPGCGRWFAAYPELAGQGEKAFQKANPSPDHRVPCASNPLLKEAVGRRHARCAVQGAREFDAWQSEFVSECECAACQKSGKGQVGLEAEAIVAAWQEFAGTTRTLRCASSFHWRTRSRKPRRPCRRFRRR